MVTKVTFKLDKDGIREVLNSQAMDDMVRDAATKIDSGVKSALPDQTVTTSVEQYKTDRVAYSVQVNDGRALKWQAENGLLTRPAAAIGAEVKASK